MNQHFAVMTDVVFRHGGTLDKYIGDGILAFFGDPIPFEDHAERAVVTALEMRQRLRGLRTRWSSEREGGLDVGIGVATGYVTVGNIGSDTRTEYTVIGNHVKLASYLAQMAGPDQILVSEKTLASSAIRERVDATTLDPIEAEGFRQPGEDRRGQRRARTAPPTPLTRRDAQAAARSIEAALPSGRDASIGSHRLPTLYSPWSSSPPVQS